MSARLIFFAASRKQLGVWQMLSQVAPPYVFLYSFTIESINTKEHVDGFGELRNRENICRELNRADAPLKRTTTALCLESIQEAKNRLTFTKVSRF